MTYVALLCGINVGGKRKVDMIRRHGFPCWSRPLEPSSDLYANITVLGRSITAGGMGRSARR